VGETLKSVFGSCFRRSVSPSLNLGFIAAGLLEFVFRVKNPDQHQLHKFLQHPVKAKLIKHPAIILVVILSKNL
jgi:hypothetical protein